LARDTPAAIEGRFEYQLYAVKAKERYKLIEDLRAADFTESCYAFGEYMHLATKTPQTTETVIDYLTPLGHTDIEIHLQKPGIEDSFMALMQHGKGRNN
jgi:hypothetical protein